MPWPLFLLYQQAAARRQRLAIEAAQLGMDPSGVEAHLYLLNLIEIEET